MNINRYALYPQISFKQNQVPKNPVVNNNVTANPASVKDDNVLAAGRFSQKEDRYSKGYKEGIMAGFNKGFQDGYQKGMEENFIKGHEVGYEEGQANIPSRFMTSDQIV